MPAAGFAAGLGTALFVAALARRGSGLDTERLILAGVSLSALFSSIIALALTRLSQGGAQEILAWLAGDPGRARLGRSARDVALPRARVRARARERAVAQRVAARAGVAQTVGLDLPRTQWMLLIAATLLTAAAVSLSGIVGFVGLIVPHVARRTFGTDARLALPGSALYGIALVAIADAASRSLFAPQEIPLGVLLAFVGVPSFLYLYLRSARNDATVGNLTLRDVRIAIATCTLLEPFSFEIAAGELVAIVGPNGVGKTTLMRAIAGFDRPPQARSRSTAATSRRDRRPRVRATSRRSAPTPRRPTA